MSAANNILNEQDLRSVLTGADGRLFFAAAADISSDPLAAAPTPAGLFMGHVNAFAIQGHFQNMDFHPIGTKMIYPIPVGRSFSLTLTETVIEGRDNDPAGAFAQLQTFIERECPVYFHFTGIVEGFCQVDARGQIERRTYQWVSMVNCVPDGTVDLMNIRPGDFISRAWSFRSASKPILKYKSDLITF